MMTLTHDQRQRIAVCCERCERRVDQLLTQLNAVRLTAGDDMDIRAEHIETELRLMAVRHSRKVAVS